MPMQQLSRGSTAAASLRRITSSSLHKTDFAFGALPGYWLMPEFSIEAA